MDILKQLKEAVSSNKLMEPVNRLNRTARTIDSLRGLLQDSKVSQSVKDMINGLMNLVTTRPNIIGINHYFNHFLLRLDPGNQPPVLKELLEVYHNRWKQVERRTANVAFDLLTANRGSGSNEEEDDSLTLLLHGEDAAVEALFDILMVRQVKTTVYQTLSRPGGSGKSQAEKLLNNGFSVHFIDESAAANVLPEVDAVLTGCHVILHEEFIAAAASHTILAAARFYKRPVYILADSRKIMNVKYFPQNAQNALLGEGKNYNRQLWKGAPDGVEVISNERETVPNYLVERFVLEDGSFTPDELRTQIDKVMVKKFF